MCLTYSKSILMGYKMQSAGKNVDFSPKEAHPKEPNGSALYVGTLSCLVLHFTFSHLSSHPFFFFGPYLLERTNQLALRVAML